MICGPSFDGVGWRTAELRYGSTGELVASEVDVDGDCFTDERTLLKYDARGERGVGHRFPLLGRAITDEQSIS